MLAFVVLRDTAPGTDGGSVVMTRVGRSSLTSIIGVDDRWAGEDRAVDSGARHIRC